MQNPDSKGLRAFDCVQNGASISIATSFDVIYLGDPGIQIDHDEGNSTAENAGALVGQTFSTVLDPLYRNTQTFAPEGSPGSSYSANNSAAN